MKSQYKKLYQTQEYRQHSPGEFRVPDFFKRVPLTPDDVVLDIGSGTGRASKAISSKCKVHALDFVNALDEGVEVEFHEHDLRKEFPVKGTVGFCCDVMEHISPKDVNTVLRNIMRSVDKCYLQICTVPDEFGEGSLHLTVKPFWWWAKRLQRFGIIRYARQEKHHVIFVVHRSLTIREMDKKMELWESDETMKSHIRANLMMGYTEARPHEIQDKEIAILAGGPSLRLFKDSGWKGPIITTNGAYNWAIENGFKPSAQMIVDPREFNKRFVLPPIDGCKYLIGSQCHPEVAKGVPHGQVVLWHSGDLVVPVLEEMAKEGDERSVFPIYGGSTVMLRGLALLIMLGFRKFQIWGWDSCLEDGEHHAYRQDENAETVVMDVLVGGKTFKCHRWMAVQAQEFVDTVKHMLPDDVEMIVHGDGLISHILKTGATYNEQQLEAA